MAKRLALPEDNAHIKAELALPDYRTVAEWAEGAIVLGEENNAKPGPLQLGWTPYLRGVLDAFQDPAVREITILASTQVGKTMAELICLGYVVDQRPGPVLWVCPTEDIAKAFCEERIQPLFRESPELARHAGTSPRDTKKAEIAFDRMKLVMAWANSPATLSSRAIRYLFEDEVDKFPPASAREADPDRLARERLRTYWDSKLLRASTPTTAEGKIMTAWKASDQRRYWVPCPHCGERQVLEFARVRWPEGMDKDDVINRRAAWYECGHCAGRIEDRHKLAMLAAGEWRREHPEAPPARHVGFRLNCLYSPWLTWSDVAGEFLASKDDREALQNFVNSWLAEPWEERVNAVSEGALSALAARARYPRGVLPLETQMVTVGVDVHELTGKGLFWAAFAWGYGRRGWLVDYGQAFTFDDLVEAVEGREWVTGDGVVFHPMAGVDSGYDAPTVYDFCRWRYPRWRPTKGWDELVGATVRDSAVDYVDKRTGQKFTGMSLLRIHTNYYKDLLAGYLQEEDAGEGAHLSVCQGVDEEFLAHLQAEHKVRERGKEIWKKKYSGIPNHYLDCTVTALALAERMGLLRLPPLRSKTQQSKPKPQPTQTVSVGVSMSSAGKYSSMRRTNGRG